MSIQLVPIYNTRRRGRGRGTIMRVPTRIQAGSGRRQIGGCRGYNVQHGAGFFDDVDEFLKTTHLLSAVGGAVAGLGGGIVGSAIGGPVGGAVGGAAASTLVGSGIRQLGYGKKRRIYL